MKQTGIPGAMRGKVIKTTVPGAAGRLVRWLMSERKKMHDGVVSIIAGMLMARYATPLMMALLKKWFGPLTGDVQGTAGFAAGIVGMSLAKLIMGMLEAHARRISEGGQPDA